MLQKKDPRACHQVGNIMFRQIQQERQHQTGQEQSGEVRGTYQRFKLPPNSLENNFERPRRRTSILVDLAVPPFGLYSGGLVS